MRCGGEGVEWVYVSGPLGQLASDGLCLSLAGLTVDEFPGDVELTKVPRILLE